MLAPAPAVEDEPIATIVIGAPEASLLATRGSGLARRTSSACTLHGCVPSAARAKPGANRAPSVATAMIFSVVMTKFFGSKRIDLAPLLLGAVFWRLFGRLYYKFSQQSSNTIMHMLGH